MQFSVVALFAASAMAVSTQTSVSTTIDTVTSCSDSVSCPAGKKTVYSTEVDTITSCASDVPSCPARKNQTISSSIYSGAADFAYGSYYAAGAAALAAGALLI